MGIISDMIVGGFACIGARHSTVLFLGWLDGALAAQNAQNARQTRRTTTDTAGE